MRTAILLLFILAPVTQAHSQQAAPPADCGPLQNAYGPYDYTNPGHRRDRLPIVERAHFTIDVYELRRGTTGPIVGDLDYTLRAFPNHHLALDAMARLHRQQNTDRVGGGEYTLTCWFERAMRFKPADGMVRMIYGTHLFNIGEFAKAEEPLLEAAKLLPKSPEAHYNVGLLYVRLGDYQQAREYAEKAYSLGFQLPGLRDQLIRAGHWPPVD